MLLYQQVQRFVVKLRFHDQWMTTASKKIGRFREPFLANKRALGKQSMPEDVGYIEDDLETTSGCSCMLDTGASPNAVPVGSSVNSNHRPHQPSQRQASKLTAQAL
jgi:hypothetical protein